MKFFLYNILLISLFFLSSIVNSQPQLMTGFPFIDSLDGPNHTGASPIISDFNNDGDNEILFCVNLNTNIGRVYLVDKNGKPLNNWPKVINSVPNFFNTSAGDVNNDDYIDILVRVKDSIFIWDYKGNYLPGFPVYFGGGFQYDDFLDKIAIYDLDNDGKLEIIVNRRSNICVFNCNGQIRNGWPREISIGLRTFISDFSIGDLNKDGLSELIIPATHYNPSIMNVDSNMIFVLKENGENFSNFPVESDSSYYFAPCPATVFKNNNDSVYFIINSNYSADFEPYNYKIRTTTYNYSGNIVQRFFTKVTYECFGIQMGKILSNMNDIAFNSIDSVYAFNNFGNRISGYPTFATGADPFRTLTLGKVTSQMNILRVSDRQDTLGGFSENRGYLWFFNPDGTQPSWSPLRTPGIHRTSPTFCDLNKDGQLDMVFVSLYSTTIVPLGTILYAFTFPGIPYNPADLPWPMYAHDRYRTNQYGFIPPDEPVSVNNNNSEIPSSFILHQNYPNPFNPSTNISFSIPKNSFVTLKVYDVLGKEVSVLVNEFKKPGNYIVTFDASNLPSGIYFYKIIADGGKDNFVETKRMAVLK